MEAASMAAGLCFGSRGGGAQLAFHHQPGAYDTDTLIGALGQLRRFLGGQKATLLWDGLPAHRSKLMRAWLRRQRSWLLVEPLPAYAPELNPVETLWANLKGVELANLAGEGLGGVIAAAWKGIERTRAARQLPYAFLRHCGLSLWGASVWECSWGLGSSPGPRDVIALRRRSVGCCAVMVAGLDGADRCARPGR
jgi:hypothetical protein